MPPVIQVRSVSKRFGGTVALDNVSLSVREGELLAICGENGAGKSTLMKILCGQYTEYEGEVFLRGERVQFTGISEAEAAGISIIHQELNLVEELTVAANIFLGRERSRYGILRRGEMRSSAASFLKMLQCDISPSAIAGSLRVGDQQLIEIARALSLGADIVIMDEPTSALTENEVKRLDDVITRLRGKGVTILYISHKMDEIFRLADRIAVLRDGRLVDVLNRRGATVDKVTGLMVGRKLAGTRRRNGDRNAIAQPVLEVRKLFRIWPGHARKWRLQDISFSLFPGEIVGIAGLMGAGRTELLESLFGCDPGEISGEIVLKDRPVRFAHPREAIEHGVAMVTEDRKRLGLFQNLNVRENISVSALDRQASGKVISPKSERRASQSVIDQLQIRLSSQAVPVGSLSGGNQQKCVIGRSLLTEPGILLLDDPTRGVDVGAKAEIYRLLDEFSKRGIAILMSSSELPELLMNCDRILVLCEGQLTAEFSADEASEEKIMAAAVSVRSG